MTALATSKSQDLREDAAALTQYAIDLSRAAGGDSAEKLTRILESGRAIWASVAKHSPDLDRSQSRRVYDQIDAAMDVAALLSARANAPR